ncbi:MAG: tetratricopeptide repeat protein [Micromonosporaceae bacterium]
MPEPQARTFALLGLHPGGEFSVPAAAALLGVSETQTRQLLDRLAVTHLVEPARRGHYRLHDLLREYAAERAAADLAEADRAAAVRRVLDWYVHTAANASDATGYSAPRTVDPIADPRVEPLEFPDSSPALAWAREAGATLVGVAEYAAEHGYHVPAYQLPWAMFPAWTVSQLLDELIAAARAGYRGARHLDSLSRYHVTNTLAGGLVGASRLDEAEPLLHETLGHARELGDPRWVSNALNTLGAFSRQRDDVDAARRYLREAVAVARTAGLWRAEATALTNTATCEIYNGTVSDGIAPSEAALAIYAEHGASAVLRGMVVTLLALAHSKLGHLERALEYADQAVGLFEESGTGPAHWLQPIGEVYVRAGRTAEARAALEQVVAALAGQPDHPDLARARDLLAGLDPDQPPA